MWEVRYSEDAMRDLKKLDKAFAEQVLKGDCESKKKSAADTAGLWETIGEQRR